MECKFNAGRYFSPMLNCLLSMETYPKYNSEVFERRCLVNETHRDSTNVTFFNNSKNDDIVQNEFDLSTIYDYVWLTSTNW